MTVWVVGVGTAAVVTLLRVTQRAVYRRLYPQADPWLEGWSTVFMEWLVMSTVFVGVFHLSEYAPLPVLLPAVLAVGILPTFDHLLRPMLLAARRDLGSPPAFLRDWLESVAGPKVRLGVVEDRLWNAFATGVLPFSQLILIGRPLLDDLTPAQLKALLAHEAGHMRLGHPFRGYLVNLACVVTMGMLLRWLYASGRVDGPFWQGALLTATVSGLAGAVLFAVIPGFVMRRLELQADRFAARMVGEQGIADALVALDRLTQGRLRQAGLTHPSLRQRLNAIGLQSSDGVKRP